MKQLITMCLIALGGFIFAKIFKVEDSQQKFLSKLLLYFINPFMVVKAFNLEFDADKLVQLGFVFAISLVNNFLSPVTTRTFFSRVASDAARLMVVVVLPTPPF